MWEMVSKLLFRMSEIKPLAVRWAWDGFVPMGRLSVITGGPGVGKSLVALQLAAMVTRGASDLPLVAGMDDGESVPDPGGADDRAMDQGAQTLNAISEQQEERSDSGSFPGFSSGGSARGVLVLSGADDPQDTVLPRLIAAGADPSLVFCLRNSFEDKTIHEPGPVADFPQEAGAEMKMRRDGDDVLTSPTTVRPFRLSQDMQKLSGCVSELSEQGIEVGMIVIDSIDRYLGANEKKSDRIEVVAQLADLAARSGAAVLVTVNSSMKAGSRGGTVVYQELLNVARSVLEVAEDEEGSERRIVRSLKQNLTARPESVSFVIEDGVVRWEGGRVKVSTAERAVRRRRDSTEPAVWESDIGEASLEPVVEPLTFRSLGGNSNRVADLSVGRATSVSDKRDLKRRERRARRASRKRNRRG
jgi:putative DNA primase/helicase